MAEEKQDQETESQNKKKKSPIMLIIVIILLLVVAGGGGYFFLFRNASHNSAVTQEKPLTYYPLKTFVANLSGNQGRRYLKVTMQFGIDNPSLSKELNADSVAIRDAIISILSSKLYDDIASEDGKNILKEQIKHAVNSILKTGKINKVYFTEFVIQ